MPTDLFFIIKGKAEEVDDDGVVINDYYANEVIGFKEFQIYLKKNIHIAGMREMSEIKDTQNTSLKYNSSRKQDLSGKYRYNGVAA